jgi:hypothetical protein
MSSTLADDLLKSRSIQELRDLVYTLQIDADGKKSELQSMVGSQYHEFIQSADRIAKMQSQSHKVMDMLTILENHTQNSIKNVTYMIQSKDIENVNHQTSAKLDLKSKPILSIRYPFKKLKAIDFVDIETTSVWKDLNNLDVSSAAVKCALAHILTRKNNISEHPLKSLLAKDVLDSLQTLDFSDKTRRELKFVEFLTEVRQTSVSPFDIHPHSLYISYLIMIYWTLRRYYKMLSCCAYRPQVPL